MRTFIAIDFKILEHYFKELQKQIQTDLAKIKFTNDFHLTLKFLGEIPDKQVEKIKELLKEIKFKPFNVEFSDTGVFPDEDYIRVVWIGFEDNRDIINLQQKVENKMQLIFQKEKRFHPHITLGRVKFVKDKQKFIEALKEIKVEKKKFEVNCFKLIKSTLTSEGPIYEDLATF